MRVSTAIRVAVVCLLSVGVARATDFDKKFPLGQTELNFDVGSGVVLTQLDIKNIPKEDEIRKDSDRAHVKPILHTSNGGKVAIRIFVTVTLEDAQGNVFLKCAKSSNIDEDEDDDTLNMCMMEYMQSKDWPKVKVVHVAGNTSPRK